MSEECGVAKAVPKRDKSMDIFPMKYDMVIISPGARRLRYGTSFRVKTGS